MTATVRVVCDLCHLFIGNFPKGQDAENALTYHKALHDKKEKDKLPPPAR